jgi:pimeloyl-ACP methyl ester carboxylesterase
MTSFLDYEGHRIAYDEFGDDDAPPLVLAHGLLMNRLMYSRLAPDMAAFGYRVICVDLLGHGESDAPADLNYYAMPAFANQIAALLDHLEIDRAVVGGTSLGANVALEFGVAHPDRAQGLFVEMPVLDNALVAVAIAFTPVLVGAQLGAPLLGVAAGLARRIPRSNYLVDIGLDWVRRDPRSSTRVLQGLLLGRTCPPHAERVGIEAPALIIGHPSDPIHPFSDSDDLAREMPKGRLVDANSIVEWRLSPGRLNRELDRFLDAVWDGSSNLRAAAA